MIQQTSSGLLLADVISLGVWLISFVIAVFGHLAEEMQIIAYGVSICAGLFTIVFGYLNYRMNKKKQRKFSKKTRK